MGCGWVGLPLAIRLADKGYEVKGSTTAAEKLETLAEEGIQPFLLQLNPEAQGDNLTDFLASELLIVNIPPKVEAKGADFHVRQIEHLVSHLKQSTISRLIYLSSTSVYPDLKREIDEEEILPQPGSNLTLLQAEQLLQGLPGIQTTILRCGGLMGYNRIPGRYVAGKTGLITGNIPVNYVHRDDVIGVVEGVIKQGFWNRTLNVVAPLHPSRKEVYLQNAAAFNLIPAQFAASTDQPFKIVSSKRLVRELAYTFLYPDPLQFLYTG
jgi:nucleoside-diphosphate-sugar epimerase